ncbi:MAG: histidine--tRNA ligase [Proteobacteria bacterium]|jgi:histidyl-tRNA synthetase|nr:histidine--tRNA ligase [Pseudomonadota bacterium]MDA1136326.1 histidine--tRNA ligase [Pseudomonadota bacterium]
MDKLRTVRGVNDLLAENLNNHNFVINKGLNISKKYCYSQIDTPIFEFSEIFTKPLGKTSDIVTKENYTFEDRSGDLLMLRPEGTSGVVRAFLNAGLTQDIPQRFSYFGPMFRYERPQKGRLRQFHQFGVELLGISSSMGDLEVISLANNFLKSLKLDNKIELKINSLGDTDSRLNYRKILVDYLNDFKKELSEDSIKRLKENPLRILDSKNPSDQAILIKAPDVLNYLNEFSKDRFEEVCDGLDSLNIDYKIDKNLVRGLDYYCHTAFEFITDQLGAQGTVLAGGRYDGLSEMLGGIQMPGVGWAAGIERLALMINANYKNNPDLVLIGLSEKFNLDLLQMIDRLIKDGIKTEILYTGNVSKKLKRANKINAQFAIIIGEDEISQNIVNLKNLKTGFQQVMKLGDAINEIKSLLNINSE